MKVSVTKIFEFEAAHHLPGYNGACKNLHGHTYKLEITVRGFVDSKTGMVMDFKKLKVMVKKKIIDKYDHSDLNNFFLMPTAENMVREIAVELAKAIDYIQPLKSMPKYSKYSGVELVRVRLWETSTSYAEVELC